MTHPNYKRVRYNVRNAFKELRKQRLVAQMDQYWNTLTSSTEAMVELMKEKKARGFVHFHHEDELTFRKNGYVYIAYGGAKDRYDNEEQLPKDVLTDLETGRLVETILKEQFRLNIEWNGDTSTRIKVSLLKEVSK